MKKLFSLLAAGAAVPCSVFADTVTPIVTQAQVGEIFTNAQTDMTSLITAAMPVVVAFVGGGLVIWGAIALVGVIKRAFGAGKGR